MEVPQPGLSVVIPTRDRPGFLETCLKSVQAALEDGDEVIVVDSASRTHDVREVAEACDAVYLRSEIPGASLARNIGWRSAQHDLIAFIDDDVIVDPQWIRGLRASFIEYPDSSFVSGQINRPEGSTKGERFAPWMTHSDPARIDASFDRDPGHSANLTIRRGALEAIGGFDELLGAGAKFRAAEDKDAFDRIFRAGFWGRYQPSAIVSHTDWRERRDALELHWNYGIGTGVRLMKLIKSDRKRARHVAFDAFWHWGVYQVYYYGRRFYRFFVLLSVVRMAGMVVGLGWGIPNKVVDGHLRPWGKRKR